jgi:hypothetical protein
MRWLKGLTALGVACFVLLGLQALSRDGADGRRAGSGLDPAASQRAADSSSALAREGPWGRLSYKPIRISPPLELMPQIMPRNRGPIEWYFPDMVSARLPALLAEIGLPAPLREQLVSLAELNPGIRGLTIHPTREIILGLSPEERAALYSVLADSTENSDQESAFRFPGDSFDEWVDHSRLSSDTRSLIEPLLYRHGTVLFFADLRTIADSLPSPKERTRLVKALSRESTFIVELELFDDSDLEELIEYWGRGGRTKDVRPILESVLSAGGDRRIDITHLLPPFARSRIYTYDANTAEELRQRRDCHWSALNFFADAPDDRFLEMDEVVRALKEDYYVIYGNLRLGDLIMYLDEKSTTVHTAVFIADDFVFTKNGAISSHPWMFMKLEDMKYYYPRSKDLKVHYLRRKDL